MSGTSTRGWRTRREVYIIKLILLIIKFWSLRRFENKKGSLHKFVKPQGGLLSSLVLFAFFPCLRYVCVLFSLIRFRCVCSE
jgi:hypothetical protein